MGLRTVIISDFPLVSMNSTLYLIWKWTKSIYLKIIIDFEAKSSQTAIFYEDDFKIPTKKTTFVVAVVALMLEARQKV